MQPFNSADHQAITALRMLSVDAIATANSGHPGIALGAAPMMYVLYSRFMNVNPKEPNWFNRDRFVMSAGHGSSLLYSMLHMSGYDITIDDMKSFRQMGSKTPGHPEFGHTPGVDATTGPLGQGFAMAVGMAMAERHLQAASQPAKVINHYTYALVGDGDLMEGISHEAASLAGVNKLNKLVVLYDSNDITLDGPLARSGADNVKDRFTGYGWNYLRVDNGEDLDAIAHAIQTAQLSNDKPTLIEVKTVIGYGAPQEGTHKVHGAPIKDEKLSAVKDFYNWQYAPFEVPVATYMRLEETLCARGRDAYAAWREAAACVAAEPVEVRELVDAMMANKTPEIDFTELLSEMTTGDKMSTRNAGNAIVQVAAAQDRLVWGGAADLAASTKTDIKAEGSFSPETPAARNINFGIREFGQAAAMNGIALHGGARVFGSAFFVFSDYLKAAVRLSALQNLPVTYVMTHDSIAVGEDGPTHEPIEQLAGFRALPNLTVMRPADAREAVKAWDYALTRQDGPTMVVETRQDLEILAGTDTADVTRGAYTISPAQGEVADGILIATGSEVQLAVAAQRELLAQDIDVAVVSMPSMELFDQQDAAYKAHVLPADVTNRLSIEMGSTFGWGKYVGLNGHSLGIDTFGASGDADQIMAAYGFTVKNVVKTYTEKFANSVLVAD